VLKSSETCDIKINFLLAYKNSEILLYIMTQNTASYWLPRARRQVCCTDAFIDLQFGGKIL
jgi:hypothetical protein